MLHAFKHLFSTDVNKTPIRITFGKKDRLKSESSQKGEGKEEQDEKISEVRNSASNEEKTETKSLRGSVDVSYFKFTRSSMFIIH